MDEEYDSLPHRREKQRSEPNDLNSDLAPVHAFAVVYTCGGGTPTEQAEFEKTCIC
jgi:hypothetical protein